MKKKVLLLFFARKVFFLKKSDNLVWLSMSNSKNLFYIIIVHLFRNQQKRHFFLKSKCSGANGNNATTVFINCFVK